MYGLRDSRPPPAADGRQAVASAGDARTAPIVDAPVERVEFTPPVLETIPEYEFLSLKIGRGDTLEQLFRKNGLNLGHLAAIARLEEPAKLFRRLKPGDEFEVQHVDGSIASLYTNLSLTQGLSIERREDGFHAEYIERPVEKRTRLAHGVIQTSLFESGADAGLPDRVIMNIAGIFAWDIDFVLDIREGDTYYVQYEELWQDGEYVT
ncbi:MAG: LysM-like peptidoglycan-binding domain-containing protein, partial [Pseudomonadota bacterium]